ncbi:MAG TPA: hypothetical protein VET88_08425 [Gammaproteobacteria bacterium]|nr:hypothetical protein [Gammaproteobacteria bacterium]
MAPVAKQEYPQVEVSLLDISRTCNIKVVCNGDVTGQWLDARPCTQNKKRQNSYG